MNKPIAITIGDPSGVGPEIIHSWAWKNPTLCIDSVVIAHKTFLDTLPDSIGKVKVGNDSFQAELGKPSDEGARIAFASLNEAAQGCIDGRYCGVVTAPISKACMQKVGFNYQGQTEFFADKWGGVPVMSFAGEKFIVSLVTWHDALKDVSALLDEGKISRAVGASNKLTQKLKGIEHPRIAVCGLNPHAGEGGIMGNEEVDVINPILDKLRERYPNLSEALPPDTVFARVLKGEFDCIVSMYHDQALAPLKAIEFDDAVNISMNLKFLRVSPDHGTAFSIAGKGIASDKSFAQAYKVCKRMLQ